ncbi:MAG: PAS domain S-box protein [Nitrospira sp.]|nr:PAS domain S-box protein [Nitrospira sp.]MDH4369665.1 PAS domain S-box protein [Nitrospira sp.]MDH5347411.1 PAS domain S-box protein [Nitrospira sp.]MDH5496865.1 PAS domain S-box protein [Nitrospira sp.]
MAPKAAKKTRWVRARPLSPALHAGDRQENAVQSATDDFFAEAFRLSPHPIGITDLETGLCLEINDACLEIFGFKRDEVIGKTTLMLGIWPDPQERARLIDRLRSEGAVRNLEVSMRMRNGELRKFLVATNLIKLNGKPCMLTIGNDITERKQAEDALRRFNETLEQRVEERTAALRTVQARQQILLTSTPVVLYACRASGDYGATFVSENVVEQLGYSARDFTDHSDFWINHIHPDDRAYVLAGLSRTFQHGRNIREYRFLHMDGTYRWLRDEVRLVRDDAGVPLELIGFQVDVSSQKWASEALREGEERLRLFIEHAPAAIAMFDRDMRYLGASRRWMEEYQLTGDCVIGRSHYDLFPDIPARWKEVHRRGLAGQILSEDEDLFVRSDGSVQWISWNVRPWYRGNEVGGIVIATEDVTARVEAQRVLHETEERSDQVVRLANFGIFDHDHRTGNVYWSPVMRELYGVGLGEPASVEGYIKLIHPDDREAVVTAMKLTNNSAGDDLNLMEHRVVRPDGSIGWLSLRSWTLFDNEGAARRPTRTLGAMIDITKRKQAEEALKLSERQFASFMDNLHGFAWIKDGQGRYLYVNRLFQESVLKGLDWKEKTAYELWPVDVAEEYELHDRKVRESGVPLHTVESFIQHGEIRHAVVSKFPIVDHKGAPVLFGGVAVDITERKQAEELLRQQADLLNQSHDAIFVWKIGGGIVYWNRGAEELYGWRSEEVIGRSSHTLLNTSPPTTIKEMEACLAQEGRWYGEITHMAKDGRRLIVESRHVRVTYGGTEYALESNRDITERKQAEEALHRNQQELHQHQVQLEELNSKLLTAQEQERRRIARDLHDDVSQRLAALVLEVASFENHPSIAPTELAKGLTTLRQGLEEVSDDVHSLAYRLHPSLLEHAGLRPAVEDHVQQVSRRTGLPIRLKILGVPTVVPLDHATCLFRVMQESVQNVVKHAQATLVTVRLRGSSTGLGLSVTDNGKGFNLDDQSTQGQGLGLSSMEERLRRLHGFFRIQSRPTHGTKVCAWVPFEMEVT